MLIFFFLIFLNLLIILNLSKLANIINIYDVPDKKLKLHKKRVPILGGLILKVGSKLIDTSIRSKLAKLKNNLKEVG